MKRAILIPILVMLLSLSLSAQITWDSTYVKTVQVKKSEHLIGIKYGVSMSNIMLMTGGIETKPIIIPHQISILYTYNHSMWGLLDYFALQTGVKYAKEGYQSLYEEVLGSMTVDVIEVPLISQFRFNVSDNFRFILNLGPYAAYRFTTDKPSGFDCYDFQFDYGIIGGGGFAIRFSPIEIHLECNYKFSLRGLYHPKVLDPNIVGAEKWLWNYPTQILFSTAVFYKF